MSSTMSRTMTRTMTRTTRTAPSIAPRIALLTALMALPASAVEFRQPVNGDVVVTAYYDLGGVQDWNCGNNTYRGHRGTDIAIIGRFAAQDEGRDIMAGAPGRVIRTHDGEFDRCTTADCAGGGGFGNHVVLEHSDGKVSYYAHMRRGSVAVREGDQVQCGQRLGQVGSSGYSTGPHLHFEVRVGGAADDPFSGPCGGPQSWWVGQGPYNGLPTRECEVAEPPAPDPAPDFHLGARIGLPERPCDFEDCRDFVRDGRSAGVPDAWIGDEIRWRIVVHNRGAGRTRAESPEDAAIELEYRVPAGFTPLGYLIESDHPAADQASWNRNDAMDNAANPPEDAVERAGVLRLNGFSPNEAKRVTLRLRVDARTIDAGPTELRAWIRHVRDYYGEKTGWNDAVEVNDRQTFNGGDLRIAAPVDGFDQRAFLFDAPDADLIEGWRRCSPDAVGGLTLNQGETALAIEVTGAAPCVESPPVQVDVGALPGVRIRARQHQGAREGWLEWTTVDAPAFGPERRVRFMTTGGGAYDDLHLAPGWSGTVTRLRLLPVADPGEGSPWFDVDQVRFTADAPPEAPPPSDDAGIEPTPGPDPGDDAGLAPPDEPQPIPEPPGDADGALPPPPGEPEPTAPADGVSLSGGCSQRGPTPAGAGDALLGVLLLGWLRGRRPLF